MSLGFMHPAMVDKDLTMPRSRNYADPHSLVKKSVHQPLLSKTKPESVNRSTHQRV